MDYHPAKDDKKDDSRMKSIRLTAKKKMFIGAVAIAACGVSAQLLKVLAPDALDLVYLCLMVFSVIVSVFRVRCSVRGEKGEVEDLSSVLIWSTPLIALFCVVSGDLYTEGFSALLQIEGANVCLAATVALAVLSFAVSAGVRYVKSDDGEGSPPESSRESAGFSTAGDGGGARAKGGESSVEGEDTSSRNKSFRQEIQQPKEVSRKTILAAMVVNVLLFAVVFAWGMSGPDAWKPDQGFTMSLVETVLLSLVGALSIVISLGVMIWFAVMVFKAVSSSTRKAFGEDEGLDAASLLICFLVLMTGCVYFRGYNFEELLSKFGGYDAFAPFVACILVAGFLAVLYNVVSFIIKNALGHKELAKAVATGFGSKLFFWIAKMLNLMISLIGAIPDFLGTVFKGVRDDEVDRWYEERCRSENEEPDEGKED